MNNLKRNQHNARYNKSVNDNRKPKNKFKYDDKEVDQEDNQEKSSSDGDDAKFNVNAKLKEKYKRPPIELNFLSKEEVIKFDDNE